MIFWSIQIGNLDRFKSESVIESDRNRWSSPSEYAKDKIRQLTRRNRGRGLAEIIRQLNQQLLGWIGYYRLTEYPSQLKDLDGWIRRKLRCYRLKQKKRSYTIAKWLIELGVKAPSAWNTAKSSKGWWRLSKTPALHQALNNEWFAKLGLVSLTYQGAMLKI